MKPQWLVEQPTGQAEILDWTGEQYHADRTALTRGMLADYLDSPALFYGRHIDGSIPPTPETDAMRLGSCFHALLDGRVIYRTWEGGTRRGAKWDAFSQETAEAGCIPISPGQREALHGMVRAVRSDPWILANVKDTAKREMVVRWTDNIYPLRFKAMLDYVDTSGDIPLIIDWKTADDPRPERWVAQAIRYRLHSQVAHYAQAMHALGYNGVRWVFIVIGSKPPHDVHLLEPSMDVYEAGDELWLDAVDGVRNNLKSKSIGPWRHANAGTVEQFGLPKWYRFERGM